MIRDTIRKFIPDSIFLRLKYWKKMGKCLHLNHPRTFNEKLQWLKLHDRNPEYTKMVDKYEVKEYVADKIGTQYIIPTYGVWDSFNEIDLNSLPNQFVLKCTHDSGGVLLCPDKGKLDIDATRRMVNNRMNRNYYWYGREWPYKNVKPRIIIEKYLSNEKDYTLLNDYKLFCFNGVPSFTLVCSKRFSNSGLKETFYDNKWVKMPLKRALHDNDTTEIPKPYNFDLMIKFAQRLSQGIPFARIDFFEVEEKLYFGEITFYPASGFEGFEPEKWDYNFGKMLILDNV